MLIREGWVEAFKKWSFLHSQQISSGKWIDQQTCHYNNKKSRGRCEQTLWGPGPISFPKVVTYLSYYLKDTVQTYLRSLVYMNIFLGMNKSSSGSPMSWCKRLSTEGTSMQISKIFWKCVDFSATIKMPIGVFFVVYSKTKLAILEDMQWKSDQQCNGTNRGCVIFVL